MNTAKHISNLLFRLPAPVLSIIAVVTLLIVTLIPRVPEIETVSFPMADKCAHLLMFGLVSTAILMDFCRRKLRFRFIYWSIIAVLVTLLGIIIEYLQDAMNMGRSADAWDAVADGIGAFLIPLIFLPVIRRLIKREHCNLSIHRSLPVKLVPQVMELYLNSFPDEERRPSLDMAGLLADKNSAVETIIITHRRKFAGFMTLWHLRNGVDYIEHFAVSTQLRGKGIGSAALERLDEIECLPLILEAEPPIHSPQARRRLDFYSAAGFTIHHDIDYTQPPYSPTLPPVKLLLLTRAPRKPNEAPIEELLPQTIDTLHHQVYGKDTQTQTPH
ncbi:MAG: GNAT family N-acetyltransferase [Bacteroides sp.]|nr:GNAT family N-acetyltransferase [Bacteroides sp.]MCM1412807.1 GNAT family N-acetyltransferase [Bacteroides sp.]MCM1470899.1 GNAT family N-acetyltransferase [Bacteroides sp.]